MVKNVEKWDWELSHLPIIEKKGEEKLVQPIENSVTYQLLRKKEKKN